MADKRDPLNPRRLIASKRSTCTRCRGSIFKGEWYYPTRNRGRLGPCCTAR